MTSERTDQPRRTVGAVSLLALGINGIVGVGIFFAPSEIAMQAGRRGSVAIMIAVAIALAPVAATFAALGRLFGEDGGPVTFARAAFGERLAFAVGWLAYVSALFSTSAVVSGLANAVLPKTWATPAGVALALLLALVAASGIDISKRAWTSITAIKLLPLLALAALAIARAPHALPAEAMTVDATRLGRAALTTCFAFQGFEVVPVIAGETRAPERSVPIAILGALGFAAVLYAVLQWAFVATAADLAVDAPLAATATTIGGARMGDLLRVGTSLSALGIAFGMVVTTPRYLSATAHAHANAGALARVDDRGVPRAALATTTAILVVILGLAKLAELFTLASLAVVLQYAVVACALAKLAWRRERGLGRRHVALAALTLAVAAVLLTVPDRAEWLSLGVLAVLGVVAYRRLGPRTT